MFINIGLEEENTFSLISAQYLKVSDVITSRAKAMKINKSWLEVLKTMKKDLFRTLL